MTDTRNYEVASLNLLLTHLNLSEYLDLICSKLKVYSVNDLKYVHEKDAFSIGMTKPQYRKLRRFLIGKQFFSAADKIKKKITFNGNLNEDMKKGVGFPNGRSKTRNIIHNESVKVIEVIGNGEYGSVCKAFWTNDSEKLLVATKSVHKEKLQQLGFNELLKEASILHKLEHKHIVTLHGIIINMDELILVMEYAPLRSLSTCLKEKCSRMDFPLTTLLEFSKQIASAMVYLESKKLIHRDLACRNVLVFSKTLVKLSDFGLSRNCFYEKDYYKSQFHENLKLPLGWMSPEAMQYLKFTTASDAWAFGVVLWELFSYGAIPWEGLSGKQICDAISYPNSQRLPRPVYCPRDVYEIMLSCWNNEADGRPTFNTLHRLLCEINFKQIRWKNGTKADVPENFLPVNDEILTVIDSSPNVDVSTVLTESLYFAMSPQGNTGYVFCDQTEPIHVVNINRFELMGIKKDVKNPTMVKKTRTISKDMISSPRGDLVHTLHIGITGDTFGDLSHLGDVIQTLKDGTPLRSVLSSDTSDKVKQISKPISIVQYDNGFPEEPSIDFGPSFFEEVMKAIETKSSDACNRHSDFLEPRENSFSDSISLQKDEDDESFSGTSSASFKNSALTNGVYSDPDGRTELDVISNDVEDSKEMRAVYLIDNVLKDDSHRTANEKVKWCHSSDEKLKNNHSNINRNSSVASDETKWCNSSNEKLSSRSDCERSSLNTHTPIETNSDLSETDGFYSRHADVSKMSRRFPKIAGVAPRWNRSYRIPINNVLKTMNAHSDVQYVNNPLKIIRDGKLNSITNVQRSSVRVANSGNTLLKNDERSPPLPDLSSLGSKLTSAESISRHFEPTHYKNHWND